MSKPILGIIGGGQLGSMLAIAANKLEIKTVIFCDDIDALHKIFLMILYTVNIMIKIRLMNF